MDVLVVQSCPILCDLMGYSLSGSFIYGILQARILEWVAIPFSRGIFPTQESNPGLLHGKPILHHLSHQGSPIYLHQQLFTAPLWVCSWLKLKNTDDDLKF